MRRTGVGSLTSDLTHLDGINRFIFTSFLKRTNVSRTLLVGVALVIFASAVWLYWPSTQGGILRMDDAEYLHQSVWWGGLTWSAVKWAFTCTDSYYHPLVRLSHILDFQIWGTNAAGHHATNVLLHALNTALVFGFLWTLLGATLLTTSERFMVALWVAVVFAIHPLQSESVAWLSARTQLLCTAFGIGSLWAYAVGARRWMVWGLYVAALLCKPTAVSLPFVMLAMDYFPLQRHERIGWWRLVGEKAPLIALAVAASLATTITEPRDHGPMDPLVIVPLSARVSYVFVSLTHYLVKVVCPAGLSPIYPADVPLVQWRVVASVLTVVIITAVAIWQRRWLPVLVAAWGAYALMILPVSGFMPMGTSVMAMRYAYVAMLPVLLLIGAAGVWVWRHWAAARGVVVVFLVCELSAFGVETRLLIPEWHNDETMRRATLAEFPNSEEANRAVAIELSDQERASEALAYAQRGVQIAPQACEAHATLGRVLCQLGRFPEAIGQQEQALQINPHSADANFYLGWILMKSGKLPQAMEHYEQALRLKPNYVEAHNNLGTIFLREGRINEAIGQYEEILRITPDCYTAHYNLGMAFVLTGRIEEAVAHLEQALRIKPDYAVAHHSLGLVLEKMGRTSEANAHYQQASNLRPDYAPTREAVARQQGSQ